MRAAVDELIHDALLSDRSRDGHDLQIGRLARDKVPAVIVLQLTPADSAGQRCYVVDVGVGDHRVAGGVRILVLKLGLLVRFPQRDHRPLFGRQFVQVEGEHWLISLKCFFCCSETT
jgi:hypothetical protein